MRITAALLMSVLLTAGCMPHDNDLAPVDRRPGSDDTGTDRSPAGNGSENNVPGTHRPPSSDRNTPGTPH